MTCDLQFGETRKSVTCRGGPIPRSALEPGALYCIWKDGETTHAVQAADSDEATGIGRVVWDATGISVTMASGPLSGGGKQRGDLLDSDEFAKAAGLSAVSVVTIVNLAPEIVANRDRSVRRGRAGRRLFRVDDVELIAGLVSLGMTPSAAARVWLIRKELRDVLNGAAA